LLGAFARLLNAALSDSELVPPCSGPESLFNQPITARRSLATLSLDLKSMKEIAQTAAVTVNDVLLAVCGAGLRGYLDNRDALPSRSLTAAIPVGLARQEADAPGNRLGLLFATLGTHLQGHLPRLKAVARSTNAGKTHLDGLPEHARIAYHLVTLLPAFLHALIPSLGKPMSNVVISNIRGPERRRFLNGAMIEAICPMSAIMSGLTLNITCVGYCDRMYLGLVACPDAVADVDELASCLSAAFADIERELRRTKKPRVSRRIARR